MRRFRRATLFTLLGALIILLSIFTIRQPTIDEAVIKHLEAQRQYKLQDHGEASGQGTAYDNKGEQDGTGYSRANKNGQGRGYTSKAHAQSVLGNTESNALDDLMAKLYPLPDRKPSAVNGPHPIDRLVVSARKQHDELLKRQSKTLEEAAKEYERRYKLHPPPNFDKWYAFAKESGVELIDEYDTIHDSVLPFWALKPATLRARVKETIGFENSMMSVAIRNGRIIKVEGAEEWQQKATKGMMSRFLEYLPDMDLAFNIHDEPRVVVPYEELERAVRQATDESVPRSFRNPDPRNGWTKPSDLGNGLVMKEYQATRFNSSALQPMWTHSRQSCPPDSAARSPDPSARDRTEAWATPDGLFVANKTAFSDICNSPSLRNTFGFFDQPNALNLVQDLVPVFSQSKISSFQDILYPSPWYWAGRVPYDPSQDRHAWEQKIGKLYWRGSTTGGYSRDGGWRRQHRQQIVGFVNRRDNAIVLHSGREKSGSDSDDPESPSSSSTTWTPRRVPKAALAASLTDVAFSSVGQCSADDCAAQRAYFALQPAAAQQRAWRYRYLLDVDGNAFSGRWHAFLRSRSLPFKVAYFREWHDEALRPWLHYVPLSLAGTECFEALRYFDRDEQRGKRQAREIAEAGSEWAKRALRRVDMEVWFFRLLLEYGRLVDDDREGIGFRLPDAGERVGSVDDEE